MYEEPKESKEMEEYQKQVQDLEREAREEYIAEKQNKSRLSASDRQKLKGLPPYEGVMFEYNNMHRSRAFKRNMLGTYGAKATGISPEVAWPTPRDIDLAEEWEKLYQPEPLSQQIAETWRRVEQRKEDRVRREQVIDEALAKMDQQVKQWQARVNTRNRQAESERHRREQVLSELKLEFGYAVNSADEYMKNRIEEREKALIKEEKEAKKLLKKEREKKATAES